jgi:hypothetical protein
MIPDIVCDAKVRKQLIDDADDENLASLRQYALNTMLFVLKGSQSGAQAHPDYSTWAAFIGEIEREQNRRHSWKA